MFLVSKMIPNAFRFCFNIWLIQSIQYEIWFCGLKCYRQFIAKDMSTFGVVECLKLFNVWIPQNCDQKIHSIKGHWITTLWVISTNQKKFFHVMIYIYIYNENSYYITPEVGTYDIGDYDFVISEFKHYSCYNVQFQINTLGNSMNPLIPHQLWAK